VEDWSTQAELGERLGIDAQMVGDLLVAAGLKVGRQATDDALRRGLAAPDTSALGRPFVRWRAGEVLPLIEPLVRRGEAPVPSQEPARAGSRVLSVVGSVQGPGTTFNLVVALQAVAEPNPGPTGWAYLNQETRTSASGALPYGTDEEGELAATIHLLDRSPAGAHLLIRSASEYLVKTATLWAPNWKRNGWKQRNGDTPRNLDLIKQLFATIEERPGRTRFGHAAADDQFVMAAAQMAAEAARDMARSSATQ
jgi:ribonuclease HI